MNEFRRFLQLIATLPDQWEAAGGFVPVSAISPIEPGQGLAGVRVPGSENAITAQQIPGESQVRITINDRGRCAGQKFALECSTAEPHNLNRLSSILGEDNTILETFRE